ncbi:S8 family peptidase [Sphingomonas lenta]|uniref:Peptidase S8/S53 domain-containing protein n=1 Tax=Sphingomonas lenta TaxID=1141887 RepID=A0A2A2SHK2_9SPHN|nr:S8/S53 family peptidase [Sphingomonas lenta]PAX08774.1 hypothetical protein CKY28_05280 [Sphingomonas lenta]
MFSFASVAEARPVVAVIDSGVAMTDELKPYLRGEFDMAADRARAAFRPRYDHGTMVATILTRAAHGQVDIVSFRIDDPAGCPEALNPPCQPSAAPIARAIRKAIELRVDGINISLALKHDPEITAAVREATRRGILVVMAAGNAGRDAPDNLDMAIAGFPFATLVGALDPSGQPWTGTNRPEEKPSGRYNYVWRPGVDVPSSIADGHAAHGTGTSFAAPIEAGLLFYRAVVPVETAGPVTGAR